MNFVLYVSMLLAGLLVGVVSILTVNKMILVKSEYKQNHKSSNPNNTYINPLNIIILAISLTFCILMLLLYGISFKTLIYIITFSICVVISAVDIKIKKIPNEAVLLLLGIALLLIVSGKSDVKAHYHFFGFIATTILFMIPFLFKNQAGAGDVKLAAVIGLYLGFPKVIYSVFIMSFIMLIYLLILIITKKGGLKTKIALGPFISAGFILALILN